jgi:hypothetical protein
MKQEKLKRRCICDGEGVKTIKKLGLKKKCQGSSILDKTNIRV